MMDPLSIAASVCGIVSLCGTILSTVGKFVVDVQAVPQALEEFNNNIRSLRTVLNSIDSFLSKKPKHHPFAQQQERKHWQDVRNVLEACNKCLHRLSRELPDPPTETSSKILQQARIQLEMTMKSNVVIQIRGHISSYTQILQLSMTTLSLGSIMDTQESQASVRSEIQKLTSEIRTTNAIIQLRQFEANPTSDDDFTLEEMSETRRNIEAWRQSAESLAAAVTSYEPDLQSVAERAEDAAFCREIGLGIRDDVSDNELHDRFERLDSTPSINGPEASMSHSDSGVEVDEVDETASDWDPEPEKEYHLSVDIIECQIAANKDNVTKLLNDGLYFQAEQYQKKRIGLQDQLLKTHKVPFHDRADAEELLAKIQGKQKTKDSLRRAKDTIQRLLAQEVERLQLEPHEDRSRLYRLYHKLGETYLELGFIPKAKIIATRALEGRKHLKTIQKGQILETAHLLANACQMNQDFDEASGLRAWIHKQTPNSNTALGANSISPAMADVLHWCKEKGFDVDSPYFTLEQPNAAGKTPLHIAVSEESLDIVRELVNHVKTLETHDKDSSATALLLASSTRNWRVVEVLLQKGALISVQDLSSNSALHRVQHAKGGLEVSKLLLKPPGQQGIKIDQKNINDKTALYLACEMGNGQMVELLLAHGADPNMAGPAYCTPLHCAIDFRRVKIVKALLEWRANVSVKDGRGRDAGKAARTTKNQSPEIKKLVAEWEGKTGEIGHRRGSASTQRRSIHSTTSELARVPSGDKALEPNGSSSAAPTTTMTATTRKASMPSRLPWKRETLVPQDLFASSSTLGGDVVQSNSTTSGTSSGTKISRLLNPLRRNRGSGIMASLGESRRDC